MSVCRTVSEILSVKEWRDLETGGRPPRDFSKSFQMASSDKSYTTFYWSAIVHIFELFDVEQSWPWKGHWKSFKLIPFESFGAVSYSPSIVTMAVSLTVYEIFSIKVYSVTLKTASRVVQGHWKWRRSIDHLTIYNFLLVRHCKYSSSWYLFWAIWRWIISWPWNMQG